MASTPLKYKAIRICKDVILQANANTYPYGIQYIAKSKYVELDNHPFMLKIDNRVEVGTKWKEVIKK